MSNRFEIFGEDGKWLVKDNEKMPHLLDLYKCHIRMNEFVDQIADLEAKLAESEDRIAKARRQAYSSRQMDNTLKIRRLADEITAKEKAITKLKQQLAEKDQAIEGLQEINQSLGQTCNNDAKEIERLREKLANTTVFAPKISNNAELILQIIESDRVGIDFLKQSQNQTAIEELKKTRHYAKHIQGGLIDYIDQQIRVLKGDV